MCLTYARTSSAGKAEAGPGSGDSLEYHKRNPTLKMLQPSTFSTTSAKDGKKHEKVSPICIYSFGVSVM